MPALPPRPVLLVAVLVAVGTGGIVAEETIGRCVTAACLIYAALIALCAILPPYRSHPVPLPLATGGFALITGCTRGLGLDMARLFAARGWPLVLVARDATALAKLALELPTETVTIVQDLASVDAADRVVEQLQAKGFDVDSSGKGEKFVDILVNNAGFAQVGMFASASSSSLQSMILLHVSTVTNLTRALLPGMLQRERGRVVVIASMVAHLPSPRAAVYAATKAFLTSFTDSISYEVSLAVDAMTRGAGTARSRSVPSPNLAVVLVSPGATRTNFAATAEADTSLIFRLPMIATDSEPVSREIVQGVIEGRSTIQPGWLNRLTVFLLPKLPSKLGHFLCFVLWGTGDLAADFFSKGPTNLAEESQRPKHQ